MHLAARARAPSALAIVAGPRRRLTARTSAIVFRHIRRRARLRSEARARARVRQASPPSTSMRARAAEHSRVGAAAGRATIAHPVPLRRRAAASSRAERRADDPRARRALVAAAARRRAVRRGAARSAASRARRSTAPRGGADLGVERLARAARDGFTPRRRRRGAAGRPHEPRLDLVLDLASALAAARAARRRALCDRGSRRASSRFAAGHRLRRRAPRRVARARAARRRALGRGFAAARSLARKLPRPRRCSDEALRARPRARSSWRAARRRRACAGSPTRASPRGALPAARSTCAAGLDRRIRGSTSKHPRAPGVGIAIGASRRRCEPSERPSDACAGRDADGSARRRPRARCRGEVGHHRRPSRSEHARHQAPPCSRERAADRARSSAAAANGRIARAASCAAAARRPPRPRPAAPRAPSGRAARCERIARDAAALVSGEVAESAPTRRACFVASRSRVVVPPCLLSRRAAALHFPSVTSGCFRAARLVFRPHGAAARRRPEPLSCRAASAASASARVVGAVPRARACEQRVAAHAGDHRVWSHPRAAGPASCRPGDLEGLRARQACRRRSARRADDRAARPSESPPRANRRLGRGLRRRNITSAAAFSTRRAARPPARSTRSDDAAVAAAGHDDA